MICAMKIRMRRWDWAGLFGGVLLGVSSEAAGAATSVTPAVATAVAPAAAKGVASAPGGGKAVKAPPSKEVLQQYVAALKAGRQADGKGQLAEARKQFAAAVVLLPEGGAAQSELGWVAYRLKDLLAAEQATRAAVRHSERPSLRAASLYNLGRILTDQGKKAEAGQAYKEAWELARNPVTLAAWKALDPVAAAAAWPSVEALTGPVALAGATPEALKQAACRAQLTEVVKKQTDADPPLTLERLASKGDDYGELSCELEEVALPSPAALQRVLVVSAGFAANHYGLSTVGLWARARDGWFFTLVDQAESWKWQGSSVAKQSVRAVGGLVEVRVVSTSRDEGAVASYYKGGQTDEPPTMSSQRDASMFVLGVGASGRPSLTSPIYYSTARRVTSEEDVVLREASKECAVKLLPSGELQIGAPVTKRKKLSEKEFSGSELQTPAGTFQLKFP